MKLSALKRAALAAGVVSTTLIGVTPGQAQAVDSLLDKLVDKGVLTPKEATELRTEVDHNFTKAYQVKSGMPDWVTALKINGDLRLRFESISAESRDFPDRNRFRYRLRPGMVAVLKDQFEVGFRLTSSEASGSFGGDPVSGNTTYSGNASKKFVYIDLAYAKWQPIKNADWGLTLTGGKMENPLHFPSTDVFDKDYTPEGFAQELTYNLNDHHSIKLTGVQSILNEIDISGKDPMLIGGQIRWNAAWSKEISSTLGATYLSLLNSDRLTTAAVPNQGRGNSRTAGGALVYGYNLIDIDAGVTYTFEHAPFYNGALPVTVSGDILHNHSAADDNTGWTAGFTVGKAGKRKTWQLDYRYTFLPADATFEEFTESDFGAFYVKAPTGGNTGYRSGTNVKGHWVKLSASPSDSVTLSVAYFFTDLVHNSPAGSESGAGRLQVDAVWKF